MHPQKPPNLHPLAESLLSRLQDHAEASEVVIGGGVALAHYSAHRNTFDLDAWWKSVQKQQTIVLARQAMTEIARSQQTSFDERRWGDVVSFNLTDKSGQKVFSFQIAERDRYLDEPVVSLWNPVLLETFRDNVASKMVALVDRGAPRDFVDLYEIVSRGLISLVECWGLYLEKRSDADQQAAKQQVLEHLERIEARRPLANITDQDARIYAIAVRSWYYLHFSEREKP